MTSPDSRERLSPKVFNFPLSEDALDQLSPNDVINKIPTEKILKTLFNRVPAKVLSDKNTYGEFGGDLIQHANSRALNLAIQGTFSSGKVLALNKEENTIRLEITFPELRNNKLWPGGKTTRVVTLKTRELLGTIAILRRAFRRN